MKKRNEKKENSFLNNLLSGALIGIGFIIPGVSGGIIAVLLGVYDKIIYSISNLKEDFIKNFIFIFSILLGIGLGSVLFSNVLIYLLEKREFPIKYIFMGFIIGGLPSLIKEIRNNSSFKAKIIDYKLLAVSIIFSVLLFFVENNGILKFSSNNLNVWNLLLAGIVYSAGKIVPGISGSALLMLLGVYEYLLNCLANPFSLSVKNILFLSPFIFSFIVSSIILIKLMNYLLKKHYNKTYSVILGFVIGSILFVYPGFNFDFSGLLCLLLLGLSSIFVIYIECITEK